MSTLYELNLSAEEAILLDGRVNDKAQVVIDKAKDALRVSKMAEGLSESEAKMVAEIISIAREKGKLTYSGTSARTCPCCGRKDGYYLVARNTKYKVKGRPDYDKPRLFAVYNLDQGFISIQHHVSTGFCDTCRPRVEPLLVDLLQDIECDTPKHWTAVQRRFVRYPKKECSKCGWQGHEGEMKPKLTMMADGHYPGGCPACPAENTLFNTVIKTIDGHVLVPYKEPVQKQTTLPPALLKAAGKPVPPTDDVEDEIDP